MRPTFRESIAVVVFKKEVSELVGGGWWVVVRIKNPRKQTKRKKKKVQHPNDREKRLKII